MGSSRRRLLVIGLVFVGATAILLSWNPFGDGVEPDTTGVTEPVVTGGAGRLVPRPIDEAFRTSPDWVELPPLPADLVWDTGVVAVWTGAEIVIWGYDEGAAFDPVDQRWRELSPSPFQRADFSNPPGALWLGEKVLLWANHKGALWDPATNTWERLPRVPVSQPVRDGRVVWTGEEIIDTVDFVSWNPSTGSYRSIAPEAIDEYLNGVWTGAGVLILPDGPFYDPSTDTWLSASPSGLSPNWTAGALFDDGRILAGDYLLETSVLNPDTDLWMAASAIPLPFGECPVTFQSAGGTFVAEHCGSGAVLDMETFMWVPFHGPRILPMDSESMLPRWIAAGDHLYAYGEEGFWRFLGDLGDPWASIQRQMIGGILFDIPEGWTRAQNDQEELALLNTGGDGECRLAAVPAEQADSEVVGEEWEWITIQPRVGGYQYRARVPAGGIRAPYTLLWAESETPIQFACPTREHAHRLLSHAIWLLQPGD